MIDFSYSVDVDGFARLVQNKFGFELQQDAVKVIKHGLGSAESKLRLLRYVSPHDTWK